MCAQQVQPSGGPCVEGREGKEEWGGDVRRGGEGKGLLYGCLIHTCGVDEARGGDAPRSTSIYFEGVGLTRIF